MGLDTSIYQNIKQFEAPSMIDSQAKAMNLSQMAMQNQRMSGQISKEEQEAKALEKSRLVKDSIPEFKRLMSLPQDKLAVEYGPTMKRLADRGMPTQNLIADANGNFQFDPQLFQMQVKGITSMPEWAAFEKPGLENQKTKSEIAYHYAQANKKNGSEYDPYKQMQMEKLAQEIEDKKFAKTTEGRLQKLGGEQKQRLDNAKLGMISVQGMSDALNNGDNTFSLIGDNDFTQQRTLFEEALGRMQSGGAINKEEEKRFKGMAPKFTDSKEMRAKKLAQLQDEMESRIGTLGFKPEEVGLAKRELSPNKKSGNDISGMGMNSANASTKSEITPQDAEALFWARKNAKDPRAQKILQMHGEQ